MFVTETVFCSSCFFFFVFFILVKTLEDPNSQNSNPTRPVSNKSNTKIGLLFLGNFSPAPSPITDTKY